MTTYMIHADGQPVSVGTVIADPLPDGLTAVALSDDDADKLTREGWRWNPSTLAVDIPGPDPEPDPIEVLQAQVAELTAVIEALLGGNP